MLVRRRSRGTWVRTTWYYATQRKKIYLLYLLCIDGAGRYPVTTYDVLYKNQTK